MKLVSEIRSGLRRIEGAMDALALPPELVHEGAQEAMVSAQIMWPGLGETNYVYASDPFDSEDESELFDPVFEIAADVEPSLQQLGGEAGYSIQQSVLVRGMDALGWYVSFHYTAVQWGIYIPVSGLVHLALSAFRSLPIPFDTKVGLAYHAIVHHELFHFATDYAIAQAELATQEAWYLPGKRAFKSGVPPYCVDEEELANAYMLSAFRTAKPALRVRGKQDALRQYIKLQPEGYRDALQVRPRDVPGKLKTLAHRYGRHAPRSAGNDLLWADALGFDWPQQFPIRPRIDSRYCPVHLIHDGQRLGLPAGGLAYFSRLSLITESGRFQSQLRQLSKPIQKAWERTKLKLGTAVTNGADFKKWEPGGENVFSVRVNDNFRAHLLRHQDQDAWEAIAIGPHKKMGHG
jgi:hypothetical protein